MIQNLLFKTILKNNQDFSNPDTREKIGIFSGILGIIINLSLTIIKLIIGTLTSSVAVTADAFNNLSDSTSSIITLISFKISNSPADKDHPYGHGRIEYVAALVIAFLVISIGFSFTKSSISKILDPVQLEFQLVPFLILAISISLKYILYKVTKILGQLIDSTALIATSKDSLGDIFTTIVIVISLLSPLFTSLPIDGYVGLLVSLLIIYSGIELVKDTISPLLGEAPDENLISSITEKLLSYKYISGVHNLEIHTYGPGKTMATIHVEFPSTVHVLDIHKVIDTAEKEIGKELDLELVIHMDPVVVEDEKTKNFRSHICSLLEAFNEINSIHDFRIENMKNKKYIIFDITLDGNKIIDEDEENIFLDKIYFILNENYPNYEFLIKVDIEFFKLDS